MISPNVFHYKPYTNDQLLNLLVAPKGQYKAIIIKEEETHSQYGNLMIVVTIRINANGEDYTLKDWLSGNKWTAARLKEYISALDSKYESGEYMVGTGKDKIILVNIDLKQDKDGKPFNVIKGYEQFTGAKPQQELLGQLYGKPQTKNQYQAAKDGAPFNDPIPDF